MAVKSNSKTTQTTYASDKADIKTQAGAQSLGDTPAALSRRSGDDRSANIKVEAKPDETADQLLRRFNREVQRSGLIQKMRDLEYYEKPSSRKKKDRKLREANIKRYLRYAEE